MFGLVLMFSSQTNSKKAMLYVRWLYNLLRLLCLSIDRQDGIRVQVNRDLKFDLICYKQKKKVLVRKDGHR